jgi:hypothetical protein
MYRYLYTDDKNIVWFKVEGLSIMEFLSFEEEINKNYKNVSHEYYKVGYYNMYDYNFKKNGYYHVYVEPFNKYMMNIKLVIPAGTYVPHRYRYNSLDVDAYEEEYKYDEIQYEEENIILENDIEDDLYSLYNESDSNIVETEI